MIPWVSVWRIRLRSVSIWRRRWPIPVSYTHLDVYKRQEKSRADEDYIRFQLEQLEEAHLAEGDQEELEDVYKRQKIRCRKRRLF